MALVYRRQTAITGNVISPDWYMENQGEFQGMFPLLDTDNLPEGEITSGMLRPNSIIEIGSDPQTGSVTLDGSSTFWNTAGSSGGDIHNIDAYINADALITVTWSGGWKWNKASGDMGRVYVNVGGSSAYVWDAVCFQIVVDGTTLADTGWLSDGNQNNGAWIRGSYQLQSGTHNIIVQSRLAQVKYGTLGDPVYGNVTNGCVLGPRSLIWKARKA